MYLINKLKVLGRVLRVGCWVLLIALIAWNFARYIHLYYAHMAREYPFSSQYGVPELVSYISQNQDKYQKIYVTDKYDQPYILFLFFMKYDPLEFQDGHELTGKDKYGFSTVGSFGKYHFGFSDFSEILENEENILVAVAPDEVPGGADIVQKIYGSNGYEYFDIITN